MEYYKTGICKKKFYGVRKWNVGFKLFDNNKDDKGLNVVGQDKQDGKITLGKKPPQHLITTNS